MYASRNPIWHYIYVYPLSSLELYGPQLQPFAY